MSRSEKSVVSQAAPDPLFSRDEVAQVGLDISLALRALGDASRAVAGCELEHGAATVHRESPGQGVVAQLEIEARMHLAADQLAQEALRPRGSPLHAGGSRHLASERNRTIARAVLEHLERGIGNCIVVDLGHAFRGFWSAPTPGRHAAR